MTTANLKNNLEEVWNKVGKEKLVAVSKTFPFAMIEEAYHLGQRHFGENRVQELSEKAQLAQEKGLTDIRFHFIGHIQSNKMKNLLAIPFLAAIHSIDSAKLVQILGKSTLPSAVELFVQVNTSDENEKSGIRDEQALLDLLTLAQQHSIAIAGLMTIGKIRTDDFVRDAHLSFGTLKKMRDQHLPHGKLSMGMSQDFMIALQYGADYVRIGSDIFGKR